MASTNESPKPRKRKPKAPPAPVDPTKWEGSVPKEVCLGHTYRMAAQHWRYIQRVMDTVEARFDVLEDQPVNGFETPADLWAMGQLIESAGQHFYMLLQHSEALAKFGIKLPFAPAEAKTQE